MKTDSIKQKIENRIAHDPKGSVYTLADFYLAGCNYEAVKRAVARLTAEDKLVRVNKGVYQSPYYSSFLRKQVAASPLDIAKKIADKNRWTIAPSGNTALNLLGLSTQVPAGYYFVSSGPYKEVELGKIRLSFKHVPLREIDGISPKSALVIEAIKALGKSGMDDVMREKITRLLSDSEKKKLLHESLSSRVWVFEEVRKIVVMACPKSRDCQRNNTRLR